MTSRRKARELALSCMYELEAAGQDIDMVIDRTIESQNVEGAAKDWLRKAVHLAWEAHENSDVIIDELAEGWKLDRVARVDLAILRLGIVELLLGLEDPRPPDPIVINEAVVLAKKFSTDDSGKFVNGIMASVLKQRDDLKSRLEN